MFNLPEYAGLENSESKLLALVRFFDKGAAEKLIRRMESKGSTSAQHLSGKVRYLSFLSPSSKNFDRFLASLDEELTALVQQDGVNGSEIEIVETRLVEDLPAANDAAQMQNMDLSERFGLTLDVGLSFGSGLHPSTRLAINALEKLSETGTSFPAKVLDVGCGSGVLSLVSAKFGALSVLGLDISDEAVEVAGRNVVSNGLEERVTIKKMSATELRDVFDLVLANLTPAVMFSSLDHISASVAEKGTCILAGFMHRHAEELRAVMEARGFRLLWSAEDGSWSGLMLTRRSKECS